MSVVRNLLVRAGADFSPLVQGMKAAQRQMGQFKEKLGGMKGQFEQSKKQIEGFGESMRDFAKTTAAAFVVYELGNYLVGATKDAISMQSAIGSLSRTLGSSAKSFEVWASTSAIAFNLSKKDALEFGRTYAQMISIFSKDTAQTKTMTIDLLKASAVVASGTGRTMQDVMDRISSGLRGETDAIEDLGIFVSASMIESTDAFKKFAGSKSWSQLSIQMQKQILYMSILEQANKQYGDSIQNNMGSQIQKLSANLSDLKVKLGDAIIPALNEIMPYLIQFASYLKTVIDAWRQFFFTLTGNEGYIKSYSYELDSAAQSMSTVKNTADSATDALNETADAMKGVAGFDEINQLASDANTVKNTVTSKGLNNASNGFTGLNTNSANNQIFDPSMFTAENTGMKSFAEKIRQYFKDFETGWDFLFNGKGSMEMFNKEKIKLDKKLDDYLKDFKTGWDYLFGPVEWTKRFEEAKKKLITVAESYKTNFETGWNFLFGPIDWTKRFEKAKTNLTFAADTYKSNFEAGWNYLFSAVDWKKRYKDAKQALITAIETYRTNFETGWNWLFEKVDWKERFKSFKTGLSDAVDLYLKNFKTGWDFLFGTDTKVKKNSSSTSNSILDFFTMPKFASGGIVNSPTIGMIGEAGPEMVVPLENTSFVDKLAGAVGTAVLGAMQMNGNSQMSGSNKDVVLKIDGYTIARALNPYLKKETNRQGNTIISIL